MPIAVHPTGRFGCQLSRIDVCHMHVSCHSPYSDASEKNAWQISSMSTAGVQCRTRIRSIISEISDHLRRFGGNCWRTSASTEATSASLIGRSGSSTFRLSTSAVSMSLTGSCFSSESAPRPFHHGIRRRGGTIFGAALPSLGRPCRLNDGRSKRTCELTSSIVPRGTSFHRSVELGFSPIGSHLARLSCCCGFPGPAELGAVNPYAMHDHCQPARQRHDRLLHAAAPGDLHRPGLEPGPFLRTHHGLSCFVEHDPHHLISAA